MGLPGQLEGHLPRSWVLWGHFVHSAQLTPITSTERALKCTRPGRDLCTSRDFSQPRRGLQRLPDRSKKRLGPQHWPSTTRKLLGLRPAASSPARAGEHPAAARQSREATGGAGQSTGPARLLDAQPLCCCVDLWAGFPPAGPSENPRTGSEEHCLRPLPGPSRQLTHKGPGKPC